MKAFIGKYHKNKLHIVEKVLELFKKSNSIDCVHSIEFENRKNSSIRIEHEGKIYNILISGDGSGRNTFLSQPFIVLHDLSNYENIYIYIGFDVKLTKLWTLNLMELKTFGIKFLIDENFTIKREIEEIKPFIKIQELVNEYENIKKISTKKKNDVVDMDYDDETDTIYLNGGRTDGANTGSFIMFILGIRKLVKNISITIRDDHNLGNLRKILDKLNINYVIRAEELKKILDDLKPNIKDRKQFLRTAFVQGEFKKNVRERNNGAHCELSGDDYLDSSNVASHIFSCDFLQSLSNSELISSDIALKIILSGDNGINFIRQYDSLFDKGKITFDDNGVLIFSTSIKNENSRMWKDLNPIKMNDTMKFLMKLHRKYTFIESPLKSKRDGNDICGKITKNDIDSLKELFEN